MGRHRLPVHEDETADMKRDIRHSVVCSFGTVFPFNDGCDKIYTYVIDTAAWRRPFIGTSDPPVRVRNHCAGRNTGFGIIWDHRSDATKTTSRGLATLLTGLNLLYSQDEYAITAAAMLCGMGIPKKREIARWLQAAHMGTPSANFHLMWRLTIILSPQYTS